MRRMLWLIVAVVALVPVGTRAWGVRAHTWINRVAVQAIPADGPVFLKAHEDWIAYLSVIPDAWRRPSEPFLKMLEDPNHGWFKEQFAFMTEIPRSRYEFVLKLYDEQRRLAAAGDPAATLTNVRWTGTMAYAAVEGYERMLTGMRHYRDAKAKNEDTRFIEQEIAFYMGWTGHYTADGAQPLHDTIHHDGWQGANPKGYTTNPQVHGLFETRFVDLMKLEGADLLPKVPAARVLTDSKNEALKSRLLEGLVSGEILPAVAWQEQAGTLDAGKIEAQATPFEGGFRVNGSKRFIVGATHADGYIVSANAKDGMQLLWVPRDAAGADMQFDTLADGRQSGTLNLANVSVGKDNVINSGAAAAESLARAIDHTAAIAGAELCGIMGRSLEITLEYLKTRVQFGKAIGSFQALQHRAVDLYIQQELSTAVLGDCLSVLDGVNGSEPNAKTRSAAASRVKARCTDAALLITRQAIQMHGAIGFTEDCDVGLYVKRAMTLAAWLGNGNAHRRRYAKTEILQGAN